MAVFKYSSYICYRSNLISGYFLFHLQKFSDSGFHKLKFPSCNLRPRRRQRWQQERLKGNRFRLAKQQLCTCITLFCTLLCCRYTITSSNVLPEFVSFRLGRIWTQDNDSLFFFFLKFDSFQNLTPEEFANIWQIERNVMKTMKF